MAATDDLFPSLCFVWNAKGFMFYLNLKEPNCNKCLNFFWGNQSWLYFSFHVHVTFLPSNLCWTLIWDSDGDPDLALLTTNVYSLEAERLHSWRCRLRLFPGESLNLHTKLSPHQIVSTMQCGLHNVDSSQNCLHNVDSTQNCLHNVKSSQNCLHNVDSSISMWRPHQVTICNK